MGICFSNSKISGSNSTTTNNASSSAAAAAAAGEQEQRLIVKNEAAVVPNINLHRIKDLNRYHHRKPDTNYNNNNNNNNNNNKNRAKNNNNNNKGNNNSNPNNKRPKAIPCGKRTDFGYLKDFDKRYSTGKLLGHGQFGYTYVAIDKSNGDRVAVKKIEKNKMVLPIAVEDVKREVKILRALSGHVNVVKFYNAYEDSSFVYIVMELCEGGELLDRILSKKDSRYTEKDAAVVVRQMLRVAAQCHLHGLVHRDMKPENFLFKSPNVDSHLKATDFGLSDYIRPGKKFTDIVGSAYYVAPEVLKRRSGPESDVLRNRPDFRRKPWPTISNSAKDLVRKLLVKNPRARLTAAQAYVRIIVFFQFKSSPVGSRRRKRVRDSARHFRSIQHATVCEIQSLKQFALRALASTLDEEEISDLKDQFHAIDVDKNGAISLEEMRQALAKDVPWKMKESRVLEILEAIDSNTDGLVDFMEFVAATLHVHQLEEHNNEKWQRLSKAAFEKFDFDKDGYITAEELQMHTGLRGSIYPLLEEADIDKDGKLSLQEFRRLLRNASMS
ncbi:hypothetical protein OSB04_000365 [Centaurea solstitialis]|uniref:non-specific serine/threonine protein kinase n=1 Tax=Centaurea solstitialis TaxID=347529 RepID=A0AA38TQQ0_9ASTR|nr:hypothetical protein OSB04_000365 [Centaurea solstitialis]